MQSMCAPKGRLNLSRIQLFWIKLEKTSCCLYILDTNNITVYTLSDLGVSSKLSDWFDSLSQANECYLPQLFNLGE